MAFEGLRDRWEHMTPRERRLMALLGVALVFTVFAFIGMTINSGLAEIEAQNDLRRDALQALDRHRIEKARPQDGPQVTIPNEAQDLPTYLENIATEVGVEIPSYQPQPTSQRGAFDELSINIDIREVTVYELADFLERVESRNRAVAITSLNIERSFREQEKLRKVSMTVTTWQKPGKQAAAAEGEEG